MYRLRTLATACALCALFASCTDAGSPVGASDRPSLNGGSFGSGNRTPADSTTSSGTTTAMTCETSRNGGSFGSGNVIEPICY